MTLPAPHFELQPAPAGLLSSYDKAGKAGGPRSELLPLHTRQTGRMAPWVVGAAIALQARADRKGYDLRFTEAWRSIEEQQRARARYLAGKGAKASRPGQSGHGYGGAIDIHTGPLADSGCTLADWHELLGLTTWRPIIPTTASKGWATSESWHADCWGPLEGIRRREGYSQAAIAGHLLLGQWQHLLDGGWSEDQVAVAVLQAGLLRAGFRCGAIDGRAGRATLAAVEAAGLPVGSWAAMAESAYQLHTHLGEDLVLRSAA